MATDPTSTAAERIRARLRAEVVAIRGDFGLTTDGRTDRLRSAYRTARDEMSALRATESTVRNGDLESASRALFPFPMSPEGRISARDALDRVERVGRAEEARTLLARAARAGDVDLARAVLQRAFDRRWRGVVASYVEAYPDDAAKVNAFLDAGASASPRRGVGDSMRFSLERPVELAADWS